MIFHNLCTITRSPGTDRWHLVWSKLGNTDDIEWLHADGIPISACDDYHVVFEATIPRGFRSGGPGDIAVDSIFFCDVPGMNWVISWFI